MSSPTFIHATAARTAPRARQECHPVRWHRSVTVRAALLVDVNRRPTPITCCAGVVRRDMVPASAERRLEVHEGLLLGAEVGIAGTHGLEDGVDPTVDRGPGGAVHCLEGGLVVVPGRFEVLDLESA